MVHLHHLATITELVLPLANQMANRSVQPFLHSSRQKVSIFYNWRPFSPKLPLRMGDLDRHLTLFFGPIQAITQTASGWVEPFFSQMTAECPYTLQWDAPSPSKLPIPMGGPGLPSNTWFPGLTRVLNLDGISITSVFAGSLV